MSDSVVLSTQVGGGHYKDAAIQPMAFWLFNQVPAVEGAVLKYVFRHRAKNGAEDLRKARHLVEYMREQYYQSAKPRCPVYMQRGWQWEISPVEFAEKNGLPLRESWLINRLFNHHIEADLTLVLSMIDDLLAVVYGEGEA